VSVWVWFLFLSAAGQRNKDALTVLTTEQLLLLMFLVSHHHHTVEQHLAVSKLSTQMTS
jgi:hypothetical protein